MQDDRWLATAAGLIAESEYTVALTGAGASVESGLPDFRSPGGIWDRYDTREYAYLDSFIRHPRKVWKFVEELLSSYGKCAPNAGHRALADLERYGRLQGVITQNIDNLHQEAGSRTVVEFHGNLQRLVCLDCRKRYAMDDPAVRAQMPPCCECGRILKPDFIFFGEMIPPRALEESFAMARRCQVLLVAGTSAEVAPASMIPYEAKRSGARVVEINTQPTVLTGDVSDIFLQGRFADVLPNLARRVSEILGTR